MAVHEVLDVYPGLIEHNAHCRNNMIVSGTLARQIAQGMNFVAAYRQKHVFSKSTWNSPIGNAAGATTPWHGAFHAGHNTSWLVFDMLLAAAGSSATDPYVYWNVTPSGGAAVKTDEFHYGEIDGSPPDYPDGYQRAVIKYQIPTKDKTYAIEMVLNDYARVASATVYLEGFYPVNDANTGVCDPRISVGSPILDTQLEDILANGTALYKRNACHLWSWSQDDASNPKNCTSSTYTNPFDSTTGTPTSSTWGQRIDTTYHNSYSASTVPVTVAIRASRTGSSTNDVQLIDTSGTQLVVLSNYTTEGWLVTGVNWPVGTTKFDVQGRVGDPRTDTLHIHAVSVYELG